jgi:hypothetical protein
VALQAAPLASFDAQEYLGLDWPQTLVTYAVTFTGSPVKANALRLVDEQGLEHPYQLSRVVKKRDGSLVSARVSFLAALAKNGSYHYQLLPGKPDGVTNPVTVTADPNYLVLDNGVTAIRLPKAGTVSFAAPLKFGANHAAASLYTPAAPQLVGDDHLAMVKLYGKQAASGIAPGPIQGIRLADGRWAGGSYFAADDPETAPRVLGYTCQVTEQGPLFTEAVIRYTFDADRYYAMTVRLLANDPAVRVDEQFDMRRTMSPMAWQVVVSLSSGWQPGGWKPDFAFWEYHSMGRTKAEPSPVAKLLKLAGYPDVSAMPALASIRAVTGFRPLKYQHPSDDVLLLENWYPFNEHAYYCGLFASQTLVENPPEEIASFLGASEPTKDAPPLVPMKKETIPFLGVVPMHPGNWRADGPGEYKPLRTHQGDDVAMHWPLGVAGHPRSYLHTGEYDPALPYTFGRRQWALVAGPLQYQDGLFKLKFYEGYINLDQYKDWILDWPRDPAVRFPRLAMSPETMARTQAGLAEHPLAALLMKQYTFNSDPKRLETVAKVSGVNQVNIWMGGAQWNPYVENYRQTQYVSWAHQMDEAMASGRLTDEQMQRLRRGAAAACYFLTSPDFNPRGSMIHLGNPNMPINRFMALPIALSQIPDHPRAKEWRAVSEQYLRYKLAMNAAPGSAWGELVTYISGSLFPLQAATALSNSGGVAPETAWQATMATQFTLHLLSPVDPRFGHRTIPGWGHEGQGIHAGWLPSAGLLRDSHPDKAKAIIWGWEQLGRPMGDEHDAGFSPASAVHADLVKTLTPDYVPKELQSTWLPGFGATLRAHAGDPNETFLSFREGYFASHSDANQGDFYLYSKGTPFSSSSLFGYAIFGGEYGDLYSQFGWHNRVRFGSRANPGDWPGGGPISNVHAHSVSDSVDYLRGMGDYGPQRWTRQILLMKGLRADGPNYFVFRDTFASLNGDRAKLEPTFWTFRTMGEQARVTATPTGMTYAAPTGQQLDVHFLQPATVSAETRQVSRSGPLSFQAARNWRAAGSPIMKDSGPDNISVSEITSVTSYGPIPAGQDVLVVLYPQGKGEAAPRYEALADGVARITTREATDYVFAHRAPMQYAQGDVAFAGIAGAVRIYPDAVHLVITEGPGQVTYKGVTLKSDVPACRVIPLAEIAAPRTIEEPAPRATITFTLNPADGKIEEIQPGVKRQVRPHGVAYAFASPEPLTFTQDDVTFIGKRGGLVIDTAAQTVRCVMLDGERIGYREAWAGECRGPYELVFADDRITGHSQGLGRFLLASLPKGLDRLPVLLLDGQPYAPGNTGKTLAIPIMPGDHQFEVRKLEQPPVFRNWEAW